jgi:hypothetical protein
MTLSGVPKLGLVNRWDGAVEGPLEVCCVGKSQDADLSSVEVTATFRRRQVFVELTVPTKVTLYDRK